MVILHMNVYGICVYADQVLNDRLVESIIGT